MILPRGTFLSGTIVLKDNIRLRISRLAMLKASPSIADFTPYPPEDVPLIAVDGSTQNKGNGPYHLIHALGAHHIAIDGGGTIDGSGSAYWDSDPQKGLVSKRPRPSPLIEFVDSCGHTGGASDNSQCGRLDRAPAGIARCPDYRRDHHQ